MTKKYSVKIEEGKLVVTGLSKKKLSELQAVIDSADGKFFVEGVLNSIIITPDVIEVHEIGDFKKDTSSDLYR